MKLIYKNLILAGSTILIFLIILEIVLRLFSVPVYGFQEGFFTYDEQLGYKLTPNYEGKQVLYNITVDVKTNSRGLRDFREYEYNKANDTFRIIFLGDSMTFGNGVNQEDSYVEQLRQLAPENTLKGMNVEIINLAVPGYGINHEYLTYLEEGQKYYPDMIIIGYTINDWGQHEFVERNGDLAVDSYIANEDGVLVYQSEGVIRAIHLSLLMKWRTYSFFYSKLRLVLSSLVDSLWKGDGTSPFLINPNSEEYQEDYIGYEDLLIKLRDETGLEVVLFIGPFLEDLASQEQLEKSYGIDYIANPTQTQEDLVKMGEDLGIKVIRIQSNDTSLYIPLDGHWNEKGNKFMAEKIAEELWKDV